LFVPALALIALTAVASPAAADTNTLAAEWGRICLGAKGDARLAARLAAAAGWTADPTAGPAFATHPGDFTKTYVLKSGDEVHVVRILGEHNTRPRRRRPLTECIITGAAGGDPTAAVAALLGGPAVAMDHGEAVWMLDGAGDTLQALHADEVDRARRLAAKDQAVFVHAGLQGDDAVIRYEGPSP
jgi:hypothetical protein